MPRNPPPAKTPWPHAPPHFLAGSGVFMVTAATAQKAHLFASPNRLRYLQNLLLEKADEFGWALEAWAVFPNHYHFIARSPETATTLSTVAKRIHGASSRWANQRDGVRGRTVWANYRETELTYERSYYARLNYVHQNAVHHGIVLVANQYPWCSAAWFESRATPAQVNTIYSFPTDQLNVDDVDVHMDSPDPPPSDGH